MAILTPGGFRRQAVPAPVVLRPAATVSAGALAIDASTPPVVSGAGPTFTTASFTPPAGSLLLVKFAGNTLGGTSPAAPTITDNRGTPLTYTLSDWQSRADSPTRDGQAAIWTAPVTSSVAMTVTVTNNAAGGTQHGAIRVVVLTGQAASPLGAHGKTGSASASAISQSYTAQGTGGWGFGAVCDWDAKGNFTAGSGNTVDSTGTVPTTQISWCFGRRSTADDVNTVANTFAVNPAATSTNLAWVWLEILPAAVSTGAASGPLVSAPTARPSTAPPPLVVASRADVAAATGTATAPLVAAGWRPPVPGSSLVLGSAAPSPDFQPPPLLAAPLPPPRPAGASLVVRSVADSPDAQPPPRIVAAGRALPQPGAALVSGSTAPSPDAQPPALGAGAGIRPPATGTAQVLAGRADPPVPTDTQPPPLVVGGVRPPRPAGTVVLLASQALSPDTQPAPVVAAPTHPQAPAGQSLILSPRADPIVATDSQPQSLVAAPLRMTSPGSALVLSSSAPSTDAQPAPLVVPAGTPPPRRGSASVAGSSLAPPAPTTPLTLVVPAAPRPPRTGAAFLSRGPVPPPPLPTLAPVLVSSFTILAPRPAGSVLLRRSTSDFVTCNTTRPSTGTTTRPGSGTTAYATATTARPSSGTTARPNSGGTSPPCN